MERIGAVFAEHPEMIDCSARRRFPGVPRDVGGARQRHPLADGTVLEDELAPGMMTVRPADVDSAPW